MIKAVFIDVDNTLLSFDGYVQEALRSGFRKFSLGDYSDNVCSVFTSINNGLWRSIEKGELTFEELEKIRFDRVFGALRIIADGPLFERYFKACLNESAIEVPGALDLLRYLAPRYTLCAASNGPYDQQVNRLRLGGMLKYFDLLFISEDIGFQKPSPEYFSVCMDRLNKITPALPSEVMVIGDSLTSDMAGGLAAGMRTCFYDPEKKLLPEGIRPHIVVNKLSEIKNYL